MAVRIYRRLAASAGTDPPLERHQVQTAHIHHWVLNLPESNGIYSLQPLQQVAYCIVCKVEWVRIFGAGRLAHVPRRSAQRLPSG